MVLAMHGIVARAREFVLHLKQRPMGRCGFTHVG